MNILKPTIATAVAATLLLSACSGDDSAQLDVSAQMSELVDAVAAGERIAPASAAPGETVGSLRVVQTPERSFPWFPLGEIVEFNADGTDVCVTSADRRQVLSVSVPEQGEAESPAEITMSLQTCDDQYRDRREDPEEVFAIIDTMLWRSFVGNPLFGDVPSTELIMSEEIVDAAIASTKLDFPTVKNVVYELDGENGQIRSFEIEMNDGRFGCVTTSDGSTVRTLTACALATPENNTIEPPPGFPEGFEPPPAVSTTAPPPLEDLAAPTTVPPTNPDVPAATVLTNPGVPATGLPSDAVVPASPTTTEP